MANAKIEHLTVDGTTYDIGGSASSLTFSLPAFTDSTTVTVTGVTADTVGIFGLSSAATAAEYAAAAEAQLQLTAQDANSVTIRANAGSLSTAVPCVINVLG